MVKCQYSRRQLISTEIPRPGVIQRSWRAEQAVTKLNAVKSLWPRERNTEPDLYKLLSHLEGERVVELRCERLLADSRLLAVPLVRQQVDLDERVPRGVRLLAACRQRARPTQTPSSQRQVPYQFATMSLHAYNNNNKMTEMAVCYVAGYIIEGRRRWPELYAYPRTIL